MINKINFNINQNVKTISKGLSCSSNATKTGFNPILKGSDFGLKALASNNIAAMAIAFKGNENNTSLDSALEKMNNQLNDISVNDVAEVVTNFPDEDSEFIEKLLNVSSQFENLESLNVLHDKVEDLKKEGYELYSPEEQVLGIDKIFNYLSKKKAFAPNFTIEVNKEKILDSDRGMFFVDQNFIKYIKENPEIIEHLKSNDFKLLIPQGWESGLTAFNTSSVDSVTEKISNLYEKAKSYELQGDLQDVAISKALDESVVDSLAELGLDSKIQIIKNDRVLSQDLNIDNIANNFASKKMSKSEIEKAIPESYEREPAIDILNNDAKIIGMRELGKMSESVHSKILEESMAKGFSEDDIYYVLPYKNKSYQMIAYQYQKINNVPNDRFYVKLDSLPETNKPKMVVVLDDYSGSGQSIRDVNKDFISYENKNNKQDKMIVAPYFATSLAAKFTKREFDKEGLSTLLPGKYLDSYFRTDAYSQKSRKSYYTYASLIGRNSFGGVDENIVFPYMAPDNNTEFFANKIAKNYTLNNSGVKTSGDK